MEFNWRTDLDAAPKGEDVIVAIWNSARTATTVEMGAQVYEPYEWEEGEESGAIGDIEGTFATHDRQKVVWFWIVGSDGYTDKKEIAAWMPAPPPYVPAQLARWDRRGKTMTAPAVPASET